MIDKKTIEKLRVHAQIGQRYDAPDDAIEETNMTIGQFIEKLQEYPLDSYFEILWVSETGEQAIGTHFDHIRVDRSTGYVEIYFDGDICK